MSAPPSRPTGWWSYSQTPARPNQPSVVLSVPSYPIGQGAARFFHGQGSSRVTRGHITLGGSVTLLAYFLHRDRPRPG